MYIISFSWCEGPTDGHFYSLIFRGGCWHLESLVYRPTVPEAANQPEVAETGLWSCFPTWAVDPVSLSSSLKWELWNWSFLQIGGDKTQVKHSSENWAYEAMHKCLVVSFMAEKCCVSGTHNSKCLSVAWALATYGIVKCGGGPSGLWWQYFTQWMKCQKT